MSKIVQLRVENFKRIGLVEINPTAPTVIVAGRNAQGKSSALDAIACALGGTRLAPQRPIRDGAESAKVTVTTDDGMVVTRSWTSSGSTLKIENTEGMRVQQPQAWLDKRIGAIAFDPLAFMRDKPADQVARLRELAGVDTRAIDAEHAATFAERTDVNREGKSLAARHGAMPSHEDAAPVDVSAAFAELEQVRAFEAARTAKVHEASAIASHIANIDAAIASDDAECTRLHKVIRDATLRIEELNGSIAKRNDARRAAVGCMDQARTEAAAIVIPDAAPIRSRIASAEQANAKVRDNAERAKVGAELDAMRLRSAALTAKLAALGTQKADALKAARMPIEGLGFTADGVTFNGIPLSQASSAEQLRVSTAMGLAANPDLRVILIREGSLLDADSLRVVSEMAEAADAQVWVEVVGAGPAGSVVIEDGGVAP